MHIRKTKREEINEEKEDMYRVEEAEKGRMWPIALMFGITLVVVIYMVNRIKYK